MIIFLNLRLNRQINISARRTTWGSSYIKSCDFQKILIRNLMHDFVPFKIYVYFAFACLQTLPLSVFISVCTLPIMLAHQLVFLGDLGVEKASFIQLLGLAKGKRPYLLRYRLIFSSKIHSQRNLRLMVNLVQYTCTR
jgi:hypothetical protein